MLINATALATTFRLQSKGHPTDLSTGLVGAGATGSVVSANPGSIYLYRGADWTGECTYLQQALIGTLDGPPCIPIPTDWQDIVSIGWGRRARALYLRVSAASCPSRVRLLGRKGDGETAKTAARVWRWTSRSLE